MLTHKGTDTAIDEGFEVHIVDGGDGEVENVEAGRTDGREVTVEEDEVEDACWGY